jgi:hypothetical protein
MHKSVSWAKKAYKFVWVQVNVIYVLHGKAGLPFSTTCLAGLLPLRLPLATRPALPVEPGKTAFVFYPGVSGMARPQGVEGSGMADHSDTVGRP